MKDEELKGFPTEAQIDFVIDLKRKITLEKGFCTDADIFLAGLKAGRQEEQLTKAKEIIKNIIRITWGEGWNYSLDWKVKAEQFIKEIEK